MTGTKRDNLVSGGIVLGSLVFLLWLIPAYTPEYPGYGVRGSLVPNLVVGLILVLSVLSLVRNILAYLSAKPTSPEESQLGDNSQVDRVHLWHLARFVIPGLLLMPAMQWVGFIPAGVVFMLVLQYFCGQRKPVQAVLVAVVPVCIIYVAMRYGLGVPMP